MRITTEEVNKIKNELRTDPEFDEDKKFIIQLVNKYRHGPTEKLREFDSLIFDRASNKKWSRRKFYTLLQDILVEFSKADNFPEDIDNVLLNDIDGLQGHCLEAIKLEGDILEGRELTSYARSWEWWLHDFQ
jgi:hypothetical protein